MEIKNTDEPDEAFLIAEFVASSTPATKNIEDIVVHNPFISAKKVSFSTEASLDNLRQVLSQRLIHRGLQFEANFLVWRKSLVPLGFAMKDKQQDAFSKIKVLLITRARFLRPLLRPTNFYTVSCRLTQRGTMQVP